MGQGDTQAEKENSTSGNDSGNNKTSDAESVTSTPDANLSASGVAVSTPEEMKNGSEPTIEEEENEASEAIEEEAFEEDPFIDLQAYSAGGVVLDKGMMEVKLFNNLYTQTAWFDGAGQRADLNRSTFFTSTLGLFYGLSSQVDVGLDFNWRAVHNSPPDQSPLKVLGFTNTDSSRAAISYIGPKIRFNPIRRNKNITIQSAVWIPIADSMQGPPFMEWDRYQLWLSFYYNTTFANDKLQFFGAVEYVPRIKRNSDPALSSDLIVFNKALISWFATKDITLYGQGEFGPSLGLGNNPSSGYYLAFGAGGKYFIADKVTLDLLYTHFVAGRAGGAGVTYNLGLSYIFRAH